MERRRTTNNTRRIFFFVHVDGKKIIRPRVRMAQNKTDAEKLAEIDAELRQLEAIQSVLRGKRQALYEKKREEESTRDCMKCGKRGGVHSATLWNGSTAQHEHIGWLCYECNRKHENAPHAQGMNVRLR